MRHQFATLLLLLLVSGCGQSDKSGPNSGASGSNTALAKATVGPTAYSAPPAVAASARKVSVSNDLIDFEYGFPAAAAAIPALKLFLDRDLATRQHELEDNARAGRKDAKQGGFDFHPFGSWIDWKVVTDLPGWLSLSTEIGSYEGGAHPNSAFDAMVWDKAANLRRNPLDLFISKQKLSSVIRADFCRQIDNQRTEKRGAPVKRGSDELFSDCIDPVDSTIILGSSNHQTFDRIGVLVAPYDAGPYAEGTFVATMPVTAAVLATVKPEYRASFSIKN